MNELQQKLKNLSTDLLRELHENGFREAEFLAMAQTVTADPSGRNRLADGVTPPKDTDIESPVDRARFERVGREALSKGQVAFVVLAGGMATRMGGVVKALVPAVGTLTFLDLRLAEQANWGKRMGVSPPLWLMTSHATDAPLRKALGSREDGRSVALFRQNASLRLTPNKDLFVDDKGRPQIYAPGHGDLPEALRRSGLLDAFVASGGKYVWIANIDNLGAGIDPVLLGWHISHHQAVSVEVVEKIGSDKGGIPVRWRDKPMILEEFRLPLTFDPAQVRVFNTNTFIVDAEPLASYAMPFTWVQVTKHVNGREAIQFERLIGEITTHLSTKFVLVPREGKASRFLPVKSNEELEKRRDAMKILAQSRGMLP